MKILMDGVILPKKPLTNSEILDVIKKLGIKKNFRGVFQRDWYQKIVKQRMWYA